MSMKIKQMPDGSKWQAVNTVKPAHEQGSVLMQRIKRLSQMQGKVLRIIYDQLEKGKHQISNRFIAEVAGVSRSYVIACIMPLIKKGLLVRNGITTDRTFAETEAGRRVLHLSKSTPSTEQSDSKIAEQAKFSDMTVSQFKVFRAIVEHLIEDHQRHELDTNMRDKSIRRYCPNMSDVSPVVKSLAEQQVISMRTDSADGRIIILTLKGCKVARLAGLKAVGGTIDKRTLHKTKATRAVSDFEPLDVNTVEYPYTMVFHNVFPIERGALYGTQDQVAFIGKTVHKYLDHSRWLRFFVKGNMLAVRKQKVSSDQAVHVREQGKLLVIWNPYMAKYLSRKAKVPMERHRILQVSGKKQDGVLFFDLSKIEPYIV